MAAKGIFRAETICPVAHFRVRLRFMCYSALVEMDLKKYRTAFGTKVERAPVTDIFERRAAGEKIEIPTAFERNFLEGEGVPGLRELILEYRDKREQELERKLFAARARLAEAERRVEKRPSKAAAKEKAVAERQIARFLRRLGKHEPESRVYAFQWAPLVIWERGARRVELMRYHLRPAKAGASFDRAYPGCYNARRDNLTGFWRPQFGRRHGLLVAHAFYENVKRHDYEKRLPRPGEKEENLVLEFRPEGFQTMLIPCLWDEWGQGDKKLRSFALITDVPPPEVAATGHDRCPVFLKESHIDGWLRPEGKSDEELFALLDDREKPFYRHALSA